jgi:ABC-type lipoprotein release transport system permease subunit
MIWLIAWKNIWRNKVRSLIVIFAVLIGIFSGVFLVGFMTGWINQRIYDALHYEISHIQIHNPEYVLNEEVQFTIPDYQKVEDSLSATQGILAFAPRVKIFGMAQSDWASSGLMIKGIYPEKEKKVTDIDNKIIAGTYFENDKGLPSIILGSKAAENLKLLNFEVTEEKLASLDENLKAKLKRLSGERYRTRKEFEVALKNVLGTEYHKLNLNDLFHRFSFYRLRAKITVTLQNMKGEMVFITFRLKGIFDTSNDMFDGITAFVKADDLKKLMNIKDNDYHEIVIITESKDDAVAIASVLKEKLPGQNIMSWKEISPDLSYYNDFMKILDFIYVGIFLLALSFGIINTMLMAVLERVKELGMLMAIGMNKLKVFLMIMLESVMLTFTGAFFGMLISGALIYHLGKTGINLSMWAQGLEAIGYASVIYPAISFDIYLGVSLMVIITGILSSIWPARKALQLNPVEAIRTE